MTTTPQIPVVNAGELYLNGLQLSMNADNEALYINVARGAARDSKNVNDIVLQDNVVLKLDRQGINALDTGTVEADTLYAVYAIGSSIALVGNGQASTLYPTGTLFSKEFVRPYMPAGYDMFRRIGAIATDSSAEIVPFAQIGNDTRRTMRYGIEANILLNGNQTTWDEISINEVTSSVLMPTISTNVYLRTAYKATDRFDAFYLQPTGQPNSAIYIIGYAVVATETFSEYLVCPCNEDASISYEVDNNASTLSLFLIGYDDLL